MSDVRNFGAAGDGQTDDTEALLHALHDGEGALEFTRGDYLITETIPVVLSEVGRTALVGLGGTAKIIMAGSGPAFHFIGTHDKNADPAGFAAEVWQQERMPLVSNLEIEGRHAGASGILVEGVMQPSFHGVLLRKLVDAIQVRNRCRNVLVSHCHIYNNRGVGVFFDHLNLHQAIISGSHISYCLRGGIKIVGSEIRNLQITGNDIEYNYDVNTAASADIWIDSTAENASVREGTIASNTIQAKVSPGGANIRIVGHNPERNHKAGMLAITGNLIGSQETNVHLLACRGVVLSGNVIYSGHRRNLHIEGSRNIVVGPNSFDHNPDYDPRELCTGVRIENSVDCTLTGLLVHDCQAGQPTVPGVPPLDRQGLVEIVRSRRVTASGCHLADGVPANLYVEDSDYVSVTGSTFHDTRAEKKSGPMVRWKGQGKGNYFAANSLGRGTAEPLEIDDAAGVTIGDNRVDGA